MSRKTTKSVLSRDEISLLLSSEEPKNINLYGNLYETLLQIKNLKAITIQQLTELNLNEIGIAALTYNKQSLIDNVKQEWYVESQSTEDPDKKVRCGLCNTPNKYLFYIRNRMNNICLNIGSFCMTKFPGIEGYTEHKYQMNQIQKNQKIIARRTEFHTKIPNAMDIMDSANYYFDNLPILLSYDIYFQLKETVELFYKIYNKYVNYGDKPFATSKTSFELFFNNIEKYNQLKYSAEDFIKHNINNPLICKRTELDWLIQNKQSKVIEDISKNNGIYDENTLGKVYSHSFLQENFNLFYECNISNNIHLIFQKEENDSFRFYIEEGGYKFWYQINIKKYMSLIGAKCIIHSNFRYSEKELFSVSKIINSNSNKMYAIESLEEKIEKFGYVFLIDDATDDLYIYKKSDKSIKIFTSIKFLETYNLYKIQKHMDVYRFIGMIVSKNWISFEQQEKQGIENKINNLYFHQHIEPYQ